MGRPRSAIYEHYSTVEQLANGTVRVLCRACSQWETVADPKRMCRHLRECPQATDEQRADAERHLNGGRSGSDPAVAIVPATAASSSPLSTTTSTPPAVPIVGHVVGDQGFMFTPILPRAKAGAKRASSSASSTASSKRRHVSEPSTEEGEGDESERENKLSSPAPGDANTSTPRSKVGRPKGALHRFFQTVAPASNSLDRHRVQCSACMAWSSAPDPQRMAKHIVECASTSAGCKQEAIQYLESRGKVEKLLPQLNASTLWMPRVPKTGASTGRPRSILYQFFDTLPAEAGAQRPRVRCQSCQLWESNSDPKRLARHLMDCSSADEERKQHGRTYLERRGFLRDATQTAIKKQDPAPAAMSISTPVRPQEQPIAPPSPTLSPVRHAPRRASPSTSRDSSPNAKVSGTTEATNAYPSDTTEPSNALAALTVAETEAIEENLARAFIAHNVSWSLLDDGWFQQAMAVMRPGNGLFDTKTPFQRVVERVYAQVQATESKVLSSATQLTLICGQIADHDPRALLYWVAVDENKQRQLLGVAPRSLKAADICDTIQKKVVQLREQSKCTVHITTNLGGKFNEARQQLKSVEPLGLSGECMARHTKQILGDAILAFPVVQASLKLAALISDATDNSSFGDMVLARVNGRQKAEAKPEFTSLNLCKPTSLLWFSGIACLRQVLRLREELCDSGREYSNTPQSTRDDDISEAVLAALQDERTWADFALGCTVLEPFCQAVVLCESDRCTSGQILLLWFWLLSTIQRNSHLPIEHKQMFENRFIKRIRSHAEEHHFVCLVLDPLIRGVGLNAKGMRITRVFASRLVEHLLPEPSKEKFGQSWHEYLDQSNQFASEYWCPFTVRRPHKFWEQWTADSETLEIFTVANAVTTYVPCALEGRDFEHIPEFDSNSAEELRSALVEKVLKIKFDLLQSQPMSSEELRLKYAPLFQPVTELALEVVLNSEGIVRTSSSEAFSVQGMLQQLGHDDKTRHQAEEEAPGKSPCDVKLFDLDWLELSKAEDLDALVSDMWSSGLTRS